MTLALLLTAVTGAWAQSYEAKVFDVPASWTEDNTHISAADLPKDFVQITKDEAKALAVPADGYVVLIYGFVGENVLMMAFENGTAIPADDDDGAPEARGQFIVFQTMAKVCYPAPAGPKVDWNASTKTGTFQMPGSDVVLTPVYSAATIYSGETETPFETLKEAFANVQDGDVIKLDWNVTLAETVETLPRDGAIKFTLDLNGYIIDGMTPENAFRLRNGDYMTITDSSLGQTGGLKNQNSIGEGGAMFIFDAGRYTMGQATADLLNEVCSKASAAILLADGKEFIDLEGGAEANDGFTLRVDWKTYELAIDSKRFATFYADNKVKLVEETPAGVDFYTITGIDTDRSMASVTKLTGIVEAGTPMLVYNGTEQKQTAKIQATSDAANTANTGDIAPEFRGTATDREFTADDMAAADYYALSGGKAFAPVKGAGTLGANQCWLQFDKQEIPSARQFTIVFDDGETTGIEAIDNGQFLDEPSGKAERTIDNYYDLNGRKLNAKPTRKGVYIKNGQKVVK